MLTCTYMHIYADILLLVNVTFEASIVKKDETMSARDKKGYSFGFKK